MSDRSVCSSRRSSTHRSSTHRSSTQRKGSRSQTCTGQFHRTHRRFKGIPGGMPGLLKKLIGQEVCLILNTGEEEEVKIEAVEGHLLIAKKCNDYKFYELPCICGVIADCEEILESLLRVTDKKCGN